MSAAPKAKAMSNPYSLEQMARNRCAGQARRGGNPALREIVDVSKFVEVCLHGLALIRRIENLRGQP
jgi:hypothetical protein